MTELRACTSCNRPVVVSETACPFCAVALIPVEPPATQLGRLSRAALFAGATLAGAACGNKAKHDTHQPPPPPPQSADAGVTADQHFAEPPPVDAAVQPDAAPFVRHRLPNMPYGAPPARRRVV